MALNRIQASRLLTAAELALFQASLADQLKTHSAAQLKSLLRRSRTLRDKYRDLLQRQRVASRSRTGSKGGTFGKANERTDEKAQAFAEVLARFEERLARLEAAEARTARKGATATLRDALKKKRGAAKQKLASRPKRSAKAPARSKGAQEGVIAPPNESARAARTAKHFNEAGTQAVQGHLASADRRSQGRRDKRG